MTPPQCAVRLTMTPPPLRFPPGARGPPNEVVGPETAPEATFTSQTADPKQSPYCRGLGVQDDKGASQVTMKTS
jgi:hypothetical protein